MQRNTVDYLLDRAVIDPAAPAVCDGPTAMTYGELLASGSAIAAAIAGSRGPVPILLEKSVRAVAAIAGCLMAGACYCPLDVSAPPDRIARMLANLGADTIITAVEYLPWLAAHGAGIRVVLIDEVAADTTPVAQIIAQVRERVAGRTDADPVYVMYTSGSTGVPKGVTVSHRGVIDFIDWAQEYFGLDSHDVIGNQAPLFFDVSTLDIYLGFRSGAQVLLIRDTDFAYPLRLVDSLRTSQVTFIAWVPSALSLIAARGALAHVPDCLRWVVSLGEPMPAGPITRWLAALPDAQFANAYGPTETTVLSTAHLLAGPPEAGASIPIGRACRNTATYVLDSQGASVGVGEVGELHIGGSGVALGYWRDPSRTAEVFVQNPLHNNFRDLVYRTGDLVRLLPDGELDYVGRADLQIKHRGFRIELGEIEVAAGGLPGVAVACALYDRNASEIVLCVVVTDESAAANGRLRRALRAQLPRYMVPRRVHVLDSMPLLGNGKVDRMALGRLAGH